VAKHERWVVLSRPNRRTDWELVIICEHGQQQAVGSALDMADQEVLLGGRDQFAILSLSAYDAGQWKRARLVKPSVGG